MRNDGLSPRKRLVSTNYKGTVYYFCNPNCLARFKAEPEKFLAPSFRPMGMAGMGLVRMGGPRLAVHPSQAAVVPRPALAVRYLCPMCAGVVSDRPGACPKCGMALEPETVSLEGPANPELADMTRRFWIAVGLSAPLFVYGMAEWRWVTTDARSAGACLAVVQMALARPVVLASGCRPCFGRGNHCSP